MKNRYVIDWDQYAQTAREAAAEGAVLLENRNQVLPLKEGQHIAVFGRMQLHYYKSGTGSGGLVNTKYEIGILDALREEKTISLDQQLMDSYKDWVADHPFDEGNGWGQEPWSQEEMPLTSEMVQDAAGRNDAAVIILGRTAGEDKDAGAVPGSYLLTEKELDMLEKVCGAFERTIVLLNVGGIIDMKWVGRYQPDAVMCVWQGGMVGGAAVADLLMGRTSPSGKLTDTIAKDIASYPSTANFGDAKDNIYAEDIYVGYRYFETFAKEEVLYPFGYGLSYTDFQVEYSDVTYKDSTVSAQAKVKNIGACPGKEVVQIYVGAPQGKLGKPLRSLIAFKKTALLQPGEETVLEFAVPEYLLASYDDSGVTGAKSSYVLEAGAYEIYAGTDVRSAALTGRFVLEQLKVVKVCTEALTAVAAFERFRPVSVSAGKAELAMEPAPVRSYDPQERIFRNLPKTVPCTGDKGYKLADVYDGKVTAEAFLAQLTDQELCCMIRGEGMGSPKVTPGTAGAFGGVTEELQAYGIPCGCCSDGPSGIRMDCGTYAFSIPMGTCLACTFNEELNTQLFRFMGAEMRKNRIDTLLGPGMNIHRNPLNGRNFEYFSEDPLVTGRMAVAQLKGMHEYGVTGTIKHYATNNQEYSRRFTNAIVSERALREIYLKGFEMAVVDGGAYSIMTTYGEINGQWTGESYDLNTTILRDEWGYQGILMTDWWANMDMRPGAPKSVKLGGMVRSQNDLFMVVDHAKENSAGDDLEESLQNGTLTRGELVRCAGNILNMLMRSPVMDRSLDRISPEEREAAAAVDEDDRTDFDVVYYPIEDELELDLAGADTGRGKSIMFGLQIRTLGRYELCLKVKIDAGEVAQVPVTFFVDAKMVAMKTMNGTNGREEELKQNLDLFFGPNHFVKLYFAQAGMQITKATVRLIQA